MEKWYIYFNIILIVLFIVAIKVQIYPNEYSDAMQLNNQFEHIKHNKECINYLQNVSATPIWRFSILAAVLFTLLQLVLYILAGGEFTEKKHYFVFWILLILNWLFMYKALSTRSWHYTCNHGCMPNFKPFAEETRSFV